MGYPIHLFRRLALLAWLGPCMAGSAWADPVVIVSTKSEATELPRRNIINIFMGRYRYFPSGHAAHPYDLAANLPGKARFYQAMIGKEAAEVDIHWARLVLTGSASPPTVVQSEEMMLERVARDPYAIGYVERSRVDGRVRILFDPASSANGNGLDR